MPEPPVAADGLFDDFVYSFTKNRRFQLERIAFPLSVTQDGTETKIESKDWKFTPLFTKGGVYTLIFDNLKATTPRRRYSMPPRWSRVRVFLKMLPWWRRFVRQVFPSSAR